MYIWHTDDISFVLCTISIIQSFIHDDFKPLLAGTDTPQVSWGHTFWHHCHTLASQNFGELPNFAATNPQKKGVFFNGESFPSSIMTTRLTRQNWHLRLFFPEVSARGETWANHEGTSLWSIPPFASEILDVWCFTLASFNHRLTLNPFTVREN